MSTLQLMLEERIAEELKKRHKLREDKGELRCKEQLVDYYSTFLNRFDPEKLENLDGETLLNTMHDIQSRDSFVYSLEFINYEELLSPTFGSIDSCSAFI